MTEPARRTVNVTEGKMSKGGTNPPNTSSERPPAPAGSGGLAAPKPILLQILAWCQTDPSTPPSQCLYEIEQICNRALEIN